MGGLQLQTAITFAFPTAHMQRTNYATQSDLLLVIYLINYLTKDTATSFTNSPTPLQSLISWPLERR